MTLPAGENVRISSMEQRAEDDYLKGMGEHVASPSRVPADLVGLPAAELSTMLDSILAGDAREEAPLPLAPDEEDVLVLDEAMEVAPPPAEPEAAPEPEPDSPLALLMAVRKALEDAQAPLAPGPLSPPEPLGEAEDAEEDVLLLDESMEVVPPAPEAADAQVADETPGLTSAEEIEVEAAAEAARLLEEAPLPEAMGEGVLSALAPADAQDERMTGEQAIELAAAAEEPLEALQDSPEAEPAEPPVQEAERIFAGPSPETLAARIEELAAAYRPAGAAPSGDLTLPERPDVLEILLADPPPLQDFQALDLLYGCWPRGTTNCKSRALLAAAHNLSRNFGLPGRVPMASSKAWRMLDPSVFEAELAQRLRDTGRFIADWQREQKTFLILEFGEIELIEYLFEALPAANHQDLLAGVMNFKVLSNRRMGLLRRIPARARKQAQAMLPDNRQGALVALAHYKALLERIAEPTGFAPIVETANKAREEVEKLMKAAAGGPPPGGQALGKIG